MKEYDELFKLLNKNIEKNVENFKEIGVTTFEIAWYLATWEHNFWHSKYFELKNERS